MKKKKLHPVLAKLVATQDHAVRWSARRDHVDELLRLPSADLIDFLRILTMISGHRVVVRALEELGDRAKEIANV